MFFIWYSMSGKGSVSYLFSFSGYQTKCGIEFLFRPLMTSWTLRFIFDHPPKQRPTGRKRGKDRNKKIEYLENQKSFLDEIKSIFHSFWRPISWWKNKNLMKIADTNFNLQGKTKNISLTNVSSMSNKMKSKLVNFSISSCSHPQPLQIKNA